MQRIPRSLVAVGAGVIGIEYASMFAALGTRVTVVERRPYHARSASLPRVAGAAADHPGGPCGSPQRASCIRSADPGGGGGIELDADGGGQAGHAETVAGLGEDAGVEVVVDGADVGAVLESQVQPQDRDGGGADHPRPGAVDHLDTLRASETLARAIAVATGVVLFALGLGLAARALKPEHRP